MHKLGGDINMGEKNDTGVKKYITIKNIIIGMIIADIIIPTIMLATRDNVAVASVTVTLFAFTTFILGIIYVIVYRYEVMYERTVMIFVNNPHAGMSELLPELVFVPVTEIGEFDISSYRSIRKPTPKAKKEN